MATKATPGFALRDDIEECPLAAGHVTFIYVGDDGSLSMSNNKGAKKQMLDALVPGDRLLMAWTGQWKTDVFDLTGQVAYVRERLG